MKGDEVLGLLAELGRRIARLEAVLGLSPISPEAKKPLPTIEGIQALVEEVSGIKKADFTSVVRGNYAVSWARHLGMVMCVAYELGNGKTLAQRFGRKEHSIVSHAKTNVENLISVGGAHRDQFQRSLVELEKRFGSVPMGLQALFLRTAPAKAA